MTIRSSVQTLPTARHTVPKWDEQCYRITGEFPEAPADCERVMVVSGHDVYRSGARYFIDTAREGGDHVRLYRRRDPGVLSVCELTLLNIMDPALCAVSLGERTLIECGPIVALKGEATTLFWKIKSSCFTAPSEFARVTPDLRNVRYLVEDPVPFTVIDPLYDFGPSQYNIASSLVLRPSPRWHQAVLARCQHPTAVEEDYRRFDEVVAAEGALSDAAGRLKQSYTHLMPDRPTDREYEFLLEHPDPAVRFKAADGFIGQRLPVKITLEETVIAASWRAFSSGDVFQRTAAQEAGPQEESETFSL